MTVLPQLPARLAHVLRALLSAVLVGAAVAIVFVLPRVIGSSWQDVANRIGAIGLGTGLVILALWIGGLLTYTVAMTSSMPGLTHRKALALNLAGSSAANLLPFGGVVGTGLNVAMVRSWRLSVRHFASSTAVLNVVNLVTKLVLPVIAGVLLGSQRDTAPWLIHSAYIGAALAALVVVALVWALISRSWAARMDRLLSGLGRRFGAIGVRLTAPVAGVAGPVTALQHQVRAVFRSRWIGLTAGMVGYVLLQWALFAMCLHAVGVGANPAAVFAAFATERALTLAVVTPAGTGLAEAAATGLLVGLGFPPAASAAGVLLYRLFVYLAEIPVGALVVGTWASMRFVRRHDGGPGTLSVPAEPPFTGADVASSPTPRMANPPTASRR